MESVTLPQHLESLKSCIKRVSCNLRYFNTSHWLFHRPVNRCVHRLLVLCTSLFFLLDFVIYVISQFPHRSIACERQTYFRSSLPSLQNGKKVLGILGTNTLLVLAKQQLCSCITLFCKFISHRCTIET